ncbi:MAG: FAD-dependent oxidoreductase, partial [Granulosicoccus sp.]
MLDIAIIGSGPAGLSAAIFLYDQGYGVTIIERFDQAQAVGSGLMLQPTGLEVLRQLGLKQEIEELGQRITGMLGKVAPNGKTVLDINYQVLSDDLYGVAIHRASLFHVLYESVNQRGIPLLTGVDVIGVQRKDDKTMVKSQGDSAPEIEFDLLVDASGRSSHLITEAIKKPVHRQLAYGALWGTVSYNNTQFNQHLLEQRYKAAKVMVGVMPCGRLPSEHTQLATFFWSLRDGDYQTVMDNGIECWKSEVLQHWPAVEPLLAQFEGFEQLSHAVYSHHTLPTPYGNKIVFIGDAAHSTSPQLGQGANMALLDSMALSNALERTASVEDALTLYARMRSLHVKLFQAASLSLTPFYQSDNALMPWLRDCLFEPVSKVPFADKLVTSLGAGLLGNPINR